MFLQTADLELLVPKDSNKYFLCNHVSCPSPLPHPSGKTRQTPSGGSLSSFRLVGKEQVGTLKLAKLRRKYYSGDRTY
jgi:hypothetical protein